MMKTHKYFISGDWGTTNFRLRVVETASLRIVSQRSTTCGIKALYEAYREQSELDQFQFFARYLLEQIALLPIEYQHYLIIVSGMASANIGMKELKYAAMPFGKEGEELVVENFDLPEDRKVVLISGARSHNGMMRGEEVQAIGLADLLDQYGDGTLLLPGTHSKHLAYRQGKFADLNTFMTGELFELLSKRSILENNLAPDQWSDAREASFLEGLHAGFDGRFFGSLFSIRAKHLLEGVQKENNYFFLSGLLIGEELSYLKDERQHLFLAAPRAIQKLYEMAFQNLLPTHQLVVFGDRDIEYSLLRGHRKILDIYEN